MAALALPLYSARHLLQKLLSEAGTSQPVREGFFPSCGSGGKLLQQALNKFWQEGYIISRPHLTAAVCVGTCVSACVCAGMYVCGGHRWAAGVLHDHTLP